MKSETYSKYAYQKRVKELEEEVARLKPYRDTVIEIKDWLVPFAGDKGYKDVSPNAAYGLKLIMSRCLK